MLVKTKFLPQSIDTPEKAVAIMMKGRELGIPPMYALSNIVIVNGKPTCSAELMLALIRRDHGPGAIRVKESTNESCTVEWRTPGWEGTQEYSFTIQDAKQAGLLGKGGPWVQYTAAMLRARCISAVCRMAFPETIAGMYVAGETGGDVTVTEDGDVIAVVHPVDTRVIDIHSGEILEGAGSDPEDEPFPGGAGITRRQMKRIHAIKNDKGLTDAAVRVVHGLASGKLLTAEAAANFIEHLNRMTPSMVEDANAVAAEKEG